MIIYNYLFLLIPWASKHRPLEKQTLALEVLVSVIVEWLRTLGPRTLHFISSLIPLFKTFSFGGEDVVVDDGGVIVMGLTENEPHPQVVSGIVSGTMVVSILSKKDSSNRDICSGVSVFSELDPSSPRYVSVVTGNSSAGGSI